VEHLEVAEVAVVLDLAARDGDPLHAGVGRDQGELYLAAVQIVLGRYPETGNQGIGIAHGDVEAEGLVRLQILRFA
jgi:hypothetical protein